MFRLNISVVMCDCSYVKRNISVVICDCSYVNRNISVVICDCSYVKRNISVVMCDCSYVKRNISVVICDCSYVKWNISVVICDSNLYLYLEIERDGLLRMKLYDNRDFNFRVMYFPCVCISSIYISVDGTYPWSSATQIRAFRYRQPSLCTTIKPSK
jgi:regulator of extracellular matrix RemA (YlzA/DUF370 family)